MIRRGSFKLTYVPGCEPELFNLSKDPDEWNNLAADSEYRTVLQGLENLVTKDWEPDRCDQRRWASEDRRLAILKVLGPGMPVEWRSPSPSVPHPLPPEPDTATENQDPK